MEIDSSNLSFRLSLVQIDALKPHEEVIDSFVRSLADEIMTEGEVRDPLIVDRENYVILDGMHRFSSLRLLRSRFAPCCLVDYDSPKISVGSWFRLFAVDEPDVVAEHLLGESGLEYSRQQFDLTHLSSDSEAIIMTEGGIAFTLSNLDSVERARRAVLLEKAMVKKRHSVEYVSEIMAIERLKSGKVDLIISLPIFTKQQIRQCGVGGHLLPHKVTRHVIPSRPLRLDVPLEMLNDPDISHEEAEHRFRVLLAQRRIERKPPGSLVEGRRYEEELLVFSSE